MRAAEWASGAIGVVLTMMVANVFWYPPPTTLQGVTLGLGALAIIFVGFLGGLVILWCCERAFGQRPRDGG